MSEIADILERAADLIEPEGAWTQGAWALDRDGKPVDDDDPAAVCFCAVGAINRAMGIRKTLGEWPGEHPLFRPTRCVFAEVAGEWPLPFNDRFDRTQAEVVAKLREAAALAKATPVRAGRDEREGV